MRFVDALDIPAKTGEDAFSDFDLLRPANHRSQEFSQAAGGGVRGDPVGGLVPQRQGLELWGLVCSCGGLE
jgi:hypothetical protein